MAFPNTRACIGLEGTPFGKPFASSGRTANEGAEHNGYLASKKATGCHNPGGQYCRSMRLANGGPQYKTHFLLEALEPELVS